MEKERDLSKSLGTEWSHYISVLLHLCTAEKQYTNLSFLQARGFLRKEGSLKSIYEVLISELERPWQVNEATSPLDDLVSVSTTDILTLVKGRMKTMEIYEKLSASTNEQLPNYQPCIDVTKNIKRKEMCCVFMEPWLNVYFIEVEVLSECMMMCANLAKWDFYRSLTCLQDITDKLNRWNEVIQTRETKKLSFATSLLRGVSGLQSEPLLYTWFSKFKSGLLSKFSLYFYQLLSKQCSGNDIKGWMNKVPVDYSARIAAFARRSDAISVCLLFNGNGLQGFKGPGYHIKTEKDKSVGVTGLDLFPCIYYHPVLPTEHWPSIVMNIKDSDLSHDRNVYIYDAGIGFTYFIHQIEPRFYIVILYEGKKLEKDSSIVQFLEETTQQLRLTKVFLSLKSSKE